MEQLVERYQDELEDVRGAAPCYRHRRMNAPDLYRVEEELFENQNLAPRGSTMRVVLPTANWEWVSDWICDIHAHTDERGWAYASSWEQLRDANQLHRRCTNFCIVGLQTNSVLRSWLLLKQTEDLLDDMLVDQGAARLDALAANSEVQRRRSEMVAECQKELKWTVDEFHDLAHTLERRQSPPP
ncbi:hypothetical protein BBJ28_00019391 [Nothophytophthora sp. Chile5]|nr:hypothetical protein BBJ28_00019391 [Nothophytophthora sp. Chile5]